MTDRAVSTLKADSKFSEVSARYSTSIAMAMRATAPTGVVCQGYLCIVILSARSQEYGVLEAWVSGDFESLTDGIQTDSSD